MFTRALPHLRREADAPKEPGLLRAHVRLLVTSRRAGYQQAQLDQTEVSLRVAAVPQRSGDLAGLVVTKQVRAPDPASLQVDLHSLGAGPGVRCRGGAEELEVRVAAGLGQQDPTADLEVVVAGEPAQAAEQRGDIPSASRATIGEQERAGVGGGQLRGVGDQVPKPGEQVGGEPDPPARWERSDPAGECLVFREILRVRVPLSGRRITVLAAPRHALSIRGYKPQLHRFASEQFGVRGEDRGGDPAGLGAVDGGPVRGEEADPAGDVAGPERGDHRPTCENAHGIARRPGADLDPELGEQLDRRAAEVDRDPRLDPVDQDPDQVPGRGGSPHLAAAGEQPAQVGEDRRGGHGPGLGDQDPAGDAAADRVGPRVTSRPPGCGRQGLGLVKRR